MENLKRSPLVQCVHAHQCAFGLRSSDEQGEGPCKKPTTFMSNSVAILSDLDRQCPGCERHVHLMNGRAKFAAVYPKGLRRVARRGVQRQMVLYVSDHVMLKSDGGRAKFMSTNSGMASMPTDVGIGVAFLARCSVTPS